MWNIESLESLGLNFDFHKNYFTYTFPPPYYAKEHGRIENQNNPIGSKVWRDISLYVHFPFCKMNCSYCSLHRQLVIENNPIIRNYIDALINEIQSYYGNFPNAKVVSVYFGGGTPSLLSSNEIGDILDCIQDIFQLSECPEVTLECAPDPKMTKHSWHDFFIPLMTRNKLPVNRISCGVQSFNNIILKTMGRTGGLEAVIDILSVINQLFPKYNIDIMLGFPGQLTNKTPHQAVDDIINPITWLIDEGFELPSISLYQLWDVDSIRIMKEASSIITDTKSLVELKWQLQQGLFCLGYEPTVISTLIKQKELEPHWAIHRHVNFRHLGFGSGVYSIFPDQLVQRNRDITSYIQKWKYGKTTSFDNILYCLSYTEVWIRKIIMGLRSYQWTELSNESEYRLLEYDVYREIQKKINYLSDIGLIERSNNMIRFAKESFLIGNEISTFLHPNKYPRKKNGFQSLPSRID